MQTQRIPDSEIQYIDDGVMLWYRMRDVTIFLGYHTKSATHMLYRSHRNQIQMKEIMLPSPKGERPSLFVDRPSLKYLLSKTRKAKVADLTRLLGFEEHLAAPCKETLYVGQLKLMFPAMRFKREYQVDRYRVDLYSKDYNIIVECDEMGHQGYDETKDAERTQKINEVLVGPTWVRFNPDKADFTIVDVIAQLTTILCERTK
jgi:very-short-patch-repair endonuclease